MRNMESFEAEDERARRKVEAERAACAELVRAAGCICDSLGYRDGDFPSDRFRGRSHWDEELHNRGEAGWVLDEHDPRCVVVLAAKIEARRQL